LPGGQSAVGQNGGSASQIRFSSLHCVPGPQSAVEQNDDGPWELLSYSLEHPVINQKHGTIAAPSAKYEWFIRFSFDPGCD